MSFDEPMHTFMSYIYISNKIVRSQGICMLNIDTYFRRVLPRGYANLHLHHQSMKILVILHHHQYLETVIYLTRVILLSIIDVQ